jgi:hypothetical protein
MAWALEQSSDLAALFGRLPELRELTGLLDAVADGGRGLGAQR